MCIRDRANEHQHMPEMEHVLSGAAGVQEQFVTWFAGWDPLLRICQKDKYAAFSQRGEGKFLTENGGFKGAEPS